MGIGDWGLGIGDWGLGIGDWAQSPIPNPQSPIKQKNILKIYYLFFAIKNIIDIFIKNKYLFILIFSSLIFIIALN